MTPVMRGIRILEVAEHTFIPLASGILADWGAEVIKIEHVERGDAMRGLASSGAIRVGGGGVHVLLEHSNRGKRSLGLDLTRPEGRDILYRLVETCDIFLTNKLPAVRQKLMIDIDHIRARNPRIIYVGGSGYGTRGPDVDRGGYDALGYWARAGHAAAVKSPEVDNMPFQPVPALGDSIGAMFVAGAMATALLHRERTGEALDVDVSLLATGMWANSAAIGVSQQTGIAYVRAPVDRGIPRNPLVGMYRTADDRWLCFSMLQGFHYWPEVCEVVGHPEWTEDPRFATAELLFENGHDASDLLQRALEAATFAEWKERLRKMRGQWAPVQNTLDLAEDPMVVANDYLMEAQTRDGIPFKLVTIPIQFNGQATPPGRSPEFNEHGDEILTKDLGLTDEELLDLKIKGVVV